MADKEKSKEVYRVKEYVRYNKFGEPYKVKAYTRKKRNKGGKMSYGRVGTFYVAHDEFGNFGGSRIQSDKKKRVKKQRRSDGLSLANEEFLRGDIEYDELIKKKKDKLKIM